MRGRGRFKVLSSRFKVLTLNVERIFMSNVEHPFLMQRAAYSPHYPILEECDKIEFVLCIPLWE